jgi:amidohydrolase
MHEAFERHVERATALRRRLHQVPELCFEEHETAALIRDELAQLRVPFIAGVPGAPTATIATIGDTARPCIALRADIDALPIQEQNQVPYRSRHAGRMHACGHDGHTAILLGSAGLLKEGEADLGVCVKLIFQPAEESGGGAKRLVEAEVLDGRLGPKVTQIFALHGWPSLPLGTLATCAGPILASTDNFCITFTGRGCHGGFPHTGCDPIVAAAEAVLSLQQVVSRELDPTESAVVTVGKFTAGSAANVIPATAVLEGTVRALRPAPRAQLRQAVERRCAGVAAAAGCEVQVSWCEGYPPVVNDEAAAHRVASAAKEALGEHGFRWVPRPSMAGEDFAYYLEHVPGCFALLGLRPVESAATAELHSSCFDFNDEAIPVALRFFSRLIHSLES